MTGRPTEIAPKSGPAAVVRLGAAGFALLGAGFGAGSIWAVAHLRRTGELPMTPFGFRALSGPFEQLGSGWFSVLGVALTVLCALQGVAAVRLWRGERRGWRLAAASSPLSFALGVGFALPFLLIGIPVSLALVFVGRRSLHD